MRVWYDGWDECGAESEGAVGGVVDGVGFPAGDPEMEGQ